MLPIHTQVDTDRVGIITLNRPEKRNCMNFAMWVELGEIMKRWADDDSVRVIVLTGAGGYFCAGADISEFSEVRKDAESGARYDEATDASISNLINSPKPTIAAVSGFCIGGGMSLAMSCDFRVADDTATFGIPAARLGIVYGLVDSRNLVNLVGLPAAKHILYTARHFDSAEAQRLGFAIRATDNDAMASAKELARTMSANAPLSISGAKKLLNSITDGALSDLWQLEAAITQVAMDSDDYKEGVKAFGEKRAPRFEGR